MTSPLLRAADLYCGAGGASTGIAEAARERSLTLDLVAVNHWDVAIASHKANHPRARHLCQALESFRCEDVVGAEGLDLLAAGPECIHHSRARGGAPIRDQQRASPWNVLDWATRLDVDRVLIENVPEFRLWGPRNARGRRIRERQGELFTAFVAAFRAAGYQVEDRVVTASDFGDATARRRLFILAVREGLSLEWPRPTHGPPGSGLQRWRTARDILDFDDPGISVPEKKARGRLRSPHTFERIQIGLEVHDGAPFILRRRQHDNPPESDVRSIDEPLHTITAGATDIALITPRGSNRIPHHRMLKVSELARATSLPPDYVLRGTKAEKVRQIGNAIPVRLAQAHVGALLDAA